MKNIFLAFLSIVFLSSCQSNPFYKKLSKLNDKELNKHVSDLGTNYFYALTEKLERARKGNDCAKTQSIAIELQSIAPFYKTDWNYGNAIFDSNLALASCAYKDKKVDAALRHLIEASKTPGSPQLNTFGPAYHDLSLLSDLVRDGHKKEVLNFINSFKVYWDDEFSKDDITFWTKEMEQGRVPKFSTRESYFSKDSKESEKK